MPARKNRPNKCGTSNFGQPRTDPNKAVRDWAAKNNLRVQRSGGGFDVYQGPCGWLGLPVRLPGVLRTSRPLGCHPQHAPWK
jgi:hypothetical protein